MVTPTMVGDGQADDAAALSQYIQNSASARMPAGLPGGKTYREVSTGASYTSNATIIIEGDLLNEVSATSGTKAAIRGPGGIEGVGTTNPPRASNIIIEGRGGVIRTAAANPNNALRRALDILRTDGYRIENVVSDGPFSGFAFALKDTTKGIISGLRHTGTIRQNGADGIHLFGRNEDITIDSCVMFSSDDAISFTHENAESNTGPIQNVTVSNMILNSMGNSSIKFFANGAHAGQVLKRVRLSGIIGRITAGPTGTPIKLENQGYAQGARYSDISIVEVDLDIGAATNPSPHIFARDMDDVTIGSSDSVFRGATDGTIARFQRMRHLAFRGEFIQTIANAPMPFIYLEGADQNGSAGADIEIDLKVRMYDGSIGFIRYSNTGAWGSAPITLQPTSS